MLVWWKCTSSFISPAYLQIVCCNILVRNNAVHLISTNHRQVSFYWGLNLSVPRKLNCINCHCSKFSRRFVEQLSCFLYSSVQDPSCAHFGHLQLKPHVGAS
jgi:hypothetical protein